MKRLSVLRKQNQGVTLIELIVALALLSIVSATMISFLTLGVNQYRRQTEDVAIQRETQMLETQIRDILSDANHSIFVADKTSSAANDDTLLNRFRLENNANKTADSVMVVLNADLDYDKDSAIGPSMQIKDSQNYYLSAAMIVFFRNSDGTGGSVYYNEVNSSTIGKTYKFLDEDHNTVNYERELLHNLLSDTSFSTSNCETWPLLAEHVGALDFSLIKKANQEKHQYEITRIDSKIVIQLGSRSHSTEHSVALRNKVYDFLANNGNEADDGTGGT